MESFDKIYKYLPLFTLWALILCSVRLVLYYMQFGINIIPFVSLGEITKSILDILVPIFLTCLLFFGHLYFYIITHKSYNEKKSIKIQTSASIFRKLNIFNFGNKYATLIFTNMMLLLYSFSSIYISYFRKSELLKILIFATGILCILKLILDLFAVNKDDLDAYVKQGRDLRTLVFISFLHISLALVLISPSIEKWTCLNFPDKVSFKYASKVISSDVINYYIGSTENNLFMYDLLSKKQPYIKWIT